jgi:hypothetical protein
MDLPEIRKKIKDLGAARFKIEMEMIRGLSRKKMLKGSVVKKYKACGKEGCKCTKGDLHGPFYYLTYKEEGKTKMIFLRRNIWESAIKLNDNYRTFRSKRAQISKINSQILKLIDIIQKQNTVSLQKIYGRKR